MSRNIEKHFRMSSEESCDLKDKAERACLTESALIRMLIAGYIPREKPDDRFYECMREMADFGQRLESLAAEARARGDSCESIFRDEAYRWYRFQADIEKTFLRPEKRKI